MKIAAFVFALLLAMLQTAASAGTPSVCKQVTDTPSTTADVDAVVASCAVDLAVKPGDPEATFRYALALERAGRVEDALRMYQWAADDGYDPASEAVQRLVAAREDAAASDWDIERVELGRSMAGIATAMRRFENGLPPDPSDPLSVIAEIGTNPAVITAWVATHTRLVPYAGSLRGARGVLTDRNGNSLDRALALAALLTAAGEEVRIARAQLDAAQAGALLEASRAATVPSPDLPPMSANDMLATLRASGVPEDVATAGVDATIDGRKLVDATVAEQMAVLLPVLTQASREGTGTTTAAMEPRSIEQLKDHFWVQARRGGGWVAHDPDGITGAPSAAETFAPDAVPDELKHAVTIRVIVEIAAPSGRREETLVTWTGRAADGSGDRLVTLSHASDGIDAIAQLASAGAPPELFLAAVDATSAWTPLLWVDGRVIVEKLFTHDGQVRPADPNALTQAGRANTMVFEEAEDLLGSEADDPSVEAGIPIAEWIEIELNAPGAPALIERRTQFDLLGPARRAEARTIIPDRDQLRDRALRLTGSSDILILGANPSRAQFARTTVATVEETADNLQALVLRDDLPHLDELPHPARVAWPLRQFALERLTAEEPPAISAPNVFMFHQRVMWAPDAAVHDQAEIDIVFNDVWEPREPSEARLKQGILDSVLEGALLEGSISTAKDSVEDIAAGNDWTLLRPGEEERLVALNPDLRRHVEADLAAGHLALVSLRAASRGWWRLDASGAVLAMGPGGGGNAMAEVGLLVSNTVGAGMCLTFLGIAIAGEMSVTKAGKLCIVAGSLGAGGSLALVAAGSTVAGIVPAVYIALAAAGLGAGAVAGSAVASR